MTVEPGAGGQAFINDCASKIKVLREEAVSINKEDLIISVDGGINAKTAKICKENGANLLVAGSFIYKQEDKAQAIKDLKLA
jgi:ribulose-phosphate 3-epimerase